MKLIVEAYFQRNKTGKFFRVKKERQDRHDQDTNLDRITSLEFQITLDPEEKHHLAKIYGVIDAIGTLGGVHEIVLWCIMLMYGSLRKNVYLFSIINSLIHTENFQIGLASENNQQKDASLMTRNLPDNIDKQNKNRLDRKQDHNYTSIQRSEIEMYPRIF